MKFANRKILATAVLLIAGTQQALAAGPTASANKAGDTITNTANVQFTVGGVVQSTTPTGSANFTVDRLVNVTVATGGNTSVTPGATNRALKFTVTNNTNSPMDFELLASNLTGDNFDASGAFTYYLDDGTGSGDGVYGTGGDTLITYLDEMPSNATWTVFVVANIPNSGQTNGQLANVALQAIARNAGTAATQGAVTTETAGANTAGIDNVFNDAIGTAASDVARDGKHSDTAAYVIASATISVTKNSAVVSDPLNLTTNPKAIPGATMVYCIAVANGSSTVPATAVTVTDNIPSGTTYKAGTIRVVPGAITCDATAISQGAAMTDTNADAGSETVGGNPAGTNGNAGGTGPTFIGPVTTVTDLPVSATTTTVFQVTIN